MADAKEQNITVMQLASEKIICHFINAYNESLLKRRKTYKA